MRRSRHSASADSISDKLEVRSLSEHTRKAGPLAPVWNAGVFDANDLFQANRRVLHRASLLMVEGPLQKQQGVIHIRGRRFRELRLRGAVPPSHDFH
jgi:hypothetical protein